MKIYEIASSLSLLAMTGKGSCNDTSSVTASERSERGGLIPPRHRERMK